MRRNPRRAPLRFVKKQAASQEAPTIRAVPRPDGAYDVTVKLGAVVVHQPAPADAIRELLGVGVAPGELPAIAVPQAETEYVLPRTGILTVRVAIGDFPDALRWLVRCGIYPVPPDRDETRKVTADLRGYLGYWYLAHAWDDLQAVVRALALQTIKASTLRRDITRQYVDLCLCPVRGQDKKKWAGFCQLLAAQEWILSATEPLPAVPSASQSHLKPHMPEKGSLLPRRSQGRILRDAEDYLRSRDILAARLVAARTILAREEGYLSVADGTTEQEACKGNIRRWAGLVASLERRIDAADAALACLSPSDQDGIAFGLGSVPAYPARARKTHYRSPDGAETSLPAIQREQDGPARPVPPTGAPAPPFVGGNDVT